ncbi:hypothetical protein B1J94_11715 [Leptospira kirschneri serovar Grippotyphosa]|nr:hypothetical protein B1J94_11715 [Leptospira kirschneri serovar Grippotyphosa]
MKNSTVEFGKTTSIVNFNAAATDGVFIFQQLYFIDYKIIIFFKKLLISIKLSTVNSIAKR